MDNKGLFIVDAETDGLFGEFLSVAAVVTDENGNETDSFYGAVSNASEIAENEWVRENVLPMLQRASSFYDNSRELRSAFWQFWLKYREERLCIADVPCPVESRLFEKCASENGAEDKFLTPYPLLDLSTLLFAKGIDPLKSRLELAGNTVLKRHNALDDVRMTLNIWRMLN